MTKNITLAVDAATLKNARRIALERDTTINALVRNYLKQLAGEEAAKAKRRKEMSRFLRELRKKEKVGPVNWSRDAIYDRRVFSRH
jgi:replicative DNA helicase